MELTYVTTDGRRESLKVDENTTVIELPSMDLKSIDLAPLAICRSFYHLDLSDNESLKDVDLSPLAECKTVRTVLLSGVEIKDFDISPLASAVNLRLLKLDSNVYVPDLTPLASCTNLEDFTLNLRHSISIKLEPLTSCKKLKRLVLKDGYPIKSMRLDPLSELPELRTLRITNFRGLERLDISALESCSKLNTLDLTRMGLTSLSLAPLVSCKELEEVHLTKNHIKELDLSPLLKCEKLRVLELDYGIHMTAPKPTEESSIPEGFEKYRWLIEWFEGDTAPAAPPPKLVCFYHPERKRESTCPSCSRMICSGCTFELTTTVHTRYDGTYAQFSRWRHTYCPQCYVREYESSGQHEGLLAKVRPSRRDYDRAREILERHSAKS